MGDEVKLYKVVLSAKALEEKIKASNSPVKVSQVERERLALLEALQGLLRRGECPPDAALALAFNLGEFSREIELRKLALDK